MLHPAAQGLAAAPMSATGSWRLWLGFVACLALARGVLLAGLISETHQGNRSGIPGLDQIPNLGDLFSHNDRSTARTELIIFIRPQIIRDGTDAHYVAEELRSKLRGTAKPIAESLPHVPRVE